MIVDTSNSSIYIMEHYQKDDSTEVELTLTDETDNTYTLVVSPEDAAKAQQSDLLFAQTLLHHAKQHEEPEIEHHEIENISNAKKKFTNLEAPEMEGIQTTETLKKNWDYQTTLKLIVAVESHHEELNHPQKRKHAWQNISNDMVSETVEVTANECYKKWQNLLRSYKVAKDLKKKTGRGPSRFQFFSKIDDFSGHQPSNSSPHSIDVNKKYGNEVRTNKNILTDIPSCSKDVNKNIIQEPKDVDITSSSNQIDEKKTPRSSERPGLSSDLKEMKQTNSRVEKKNPMELYLCYLLYLFQY